ncbi:hypothetical protein PhCBS80983_g02930 [Powellomyces hirtus]|uniref:STI1/HOP DP domain-containing protein n=1 Tax=Powellomyces hirtus TaxID=109895 RepID=A0A507E6N1_9FUNG|nr:hypothetical protein PhCBS80983_g02930 [Powellomyces hirtus]
MDDIDVPPLEDMSAALPTARQLPKGNSSNSAKATSLLLEEASKKTTAKKPPVKKQVAFGFSKGFLTAAGSLKSDASKKPKQDIPVLKPRSNAPDSLRFDEVQEAMRNQMSLLDRQEWLTPEFLKRIERSPVLAVALSDPAFQQAASEMSTNPQAAYKKYAQSRPDLLEALREFAGMLGDTLSTMQDARK